MRADPNEYDRKEISMSAHESHDRHRRGNAASDADGPEWATRAATAQVKGEPSLCVGEAA